MTTIEHLSHLENHSITEFVRSHKWHGRVLDYGCGRQPYRSIVEKTAHEYVPYDRARNGGGAVGDYGPEDPLPPQWYDGILCTQVVEYVPDVYRLLRRMRESLKYGGALILTYPTVWPELPYDLHRFTREGMDRLLVAAGFVVEKHECRAVVPDVDVRLPLGYGAVARAEYP